MTEGIPPSKFVMIHDAVLNAYASPIGRKQGFIDYPESCHFDPGVMLRKGNEAPDCLTVPQLDLLRKLY